MEKLYIVTRQDLPPGLQIPQSVHAAQRFAEEHPELYGAWYRGPNNVVCLSVPDEPALRSLLGRAPEEVPHSAFEEPDLGGELTAIALGGKAKKLVQRLPLALRG
jgi:hypothetical protein